MDEASNYTGSPSEEYKSRELDSYATAIHNAAPRFNVNYFSMFSTEWADNELIPFLRRAYGGRPGVDDDHDWWEDLRKAEWNEPKHMPNYPIEDPIFVERLRLALISPASVPHQSLVASVADDMELTIRLLIRRCVMHGGPFKLASLPDSVRSEMADDVSMANMADNMVATLFGEGLKESKDG